MTSPARPPSLEPRYLELIETLAGVRGRNREGAAVRLRDISGLLPLNPKLQSAKAAGSTPTKAEFDRLVADVHEVHRRLVALCEALTKATRP